MKKTIHDISEFSFPSKERYLRRDYKKELFRARVAAVKYTILGIIALLLTSWVAYNFMSAATARAASVLLYDNARVEQVITECEAKVRELSV